MNSFLQRHYKIILFALWIIVQSVLFWHNGVVTYNEAEKYISEAQYFITNGTFSSNNYWLYSTQIFLDALAIKLHLGYTLIAIIQLSLNLLSTWMFFQLAMIFLKKLTLSFWVTVVFIINIEYQAYNSFLFTESIFYSLTIIYSSYLLRLRTFNFKNTFILILLIALMSVTRPTGILFFPATVLYVFFKGGA